jgi:glycosyltransferase involved in cell wall biosynthesis
MKTLRIASCPQPSVNPYFGLYFGALARFGVEVEYVRNVMQTPIVGPDGRAFEAVHLHWSVERHWRAFGGSTVAQLWGLWRWGRFLRRIKRAGVKVLWTVHELSPPEGGTLIDTRGYGLCARAADLCVCHSEACRQLVVQRFKVDASRTMVIPHGSYEGVLVPTQSREATREQRDLPAARRLLLCFGSQRPRKGLEVALEAMRHLGDGFHLVIQASTPSSKLRKWLDSLRDEHRGSRNVTFVDETDHDTLANLLNAADCVILPYLDIVGSGALAASLTLGRGVVVSDLPYFRESLAGAPEAGVFFPPGDARGLADAVRLYFSADDSRHRAAARQLADRLRWSDLVTPIGEWLQAHCNSERFHLSAAEADVRRGLTRA